METKYMISTNCDLSIDKANENKLFELADRLFELDLTSRQEYLLSRAIDNKDVYNLFNVFDFEVEENDNQYKIVYYNSNECKDLENLFSILAPAFNDGRIEFRITDDISDTDEFCMYAIRKGKAKKAKGLIVWV